MNQITLCCPLYQQGFVHRNCLVNFNFQRSAAHQSVYRAQSVHKALQNIAVCVTKLSGFIVQENCISHLILVIHLNIILYYYPFLKNCALKTN